MVFGEEKHQYIKGVNPNSGTVVLLKERNKLFTSCFLIELHLSS